MNSRILRSTAAVGLLWIPAADNAATPPTDGSRALCNLDINSQPLDGVLQEIARQCGVQVVYFSQITDGLTASGLKGRYAIDDALRHVLDRTGLTFHQGNADTFEIQVIPKTPEGPTHVPDNANAAKQSSQSSSGDATQLPEVTINATAEGLVATRTETPLNEIPQTISIISAEQMRQQNNTTLADALTDAVGITAYQVDSPNQVFYSRGFEITTYHLDGGAALHSFNYDPTFNGRSLFLSPDLGEFDHIEVLRGADALFGAGGNPGATVNLVRKRPQDEFSLTADSTAGSWNNFRQEVDLTGPLGFDGALRGRLDAAYAHRDYFYDDASLERKNIFVAIEYDLTSRAVLTVGGDYGSEYAQPFEGGLPTFNDGSDAHLPRGTAYTFDWNRLDTQMREAYVRFEQKFGTAWRLKVDATSLNGSADYTLGQFSSPVDPVTRSLPIPPSALYTVSPLQQKQTSVSVTITDTAEWFGHREEIAIGGDFTHFIENELFVNVPSFGPSVPDAYRYNPVAYPDPRLLPEDPFFFASGDEASSVQAGVFASLLAQITAPWSITAGVRDNIERDTTTANLAIFGEVISSPARPPYSYVGKLTPYLGTMFSITSQYSLYASYADIYDSNGGDTAVGGGRLPPADGVDVEAGIKAAWRDGAVTGSLTAYSILQRGVAVTYTKAPVVDESENCCSYPSGRNKSRGLDIELSGVIAPGWSAAAGYTFNNNEDVNPAYPLSSITPRHLLKIWTSLQLPGVLHRWTLGGTLQAQSANSDLGYFAPLPTGGETSSTEYYQPFKEVQGSYAVVSPRIGYQIDTHWKVALTVNNLFDRTYYQSIATPVGGNWYGDPRNYLLRVDGRF
jgi:outer-membrane receptor for ferric coprogen and ferric-rhodotorulic acid